MTLQLDPKLEAMIEEDLRRGPYASVDEYIAQAVALLHGQEEWLAVQCGGDCREDRASRAAGRAGGIASRGSRIRRACPPP
jgi:Arc/MetJ-type ribon-helix-helix transcriptional regulator